MHVHDFFLYINPNTENEVYWGTRIPQIRSALSGKSTDVEKSEETMKIEPRNRFAVVEKKLMAKNVNEKSKNGKFRYFGFFFFLQLCQTCKKKKKIFNVY